MKNVTRLYALLATALMITTLVTTSDAQRGPGGGGQGGPQQGGPGGGGQRQRGQQGGPMYIIKMSTVQAHLNLTQAQKDSIAALRPPQGGPGQGGPGGGGQGGPQGGSQGGNQGGGPGGPGGNGEQRPNPLAEILNETQMNRLNQLALQFDAPMSILDKKSAQELALTAAQKQELDTIIKNAFPRPQGGPGGGQGGPRGGGQGGPGGNGGGQGGPGGNGGGQGGPGGNGGPRPTPPTFAEMQAKKAAAFNLAWDVLTAAQKEKWNTMTGAKFTNWVEVPRPNN